MVNDENKNRKESAIEALLGRELLAGLDKTVTTSSRLKGKKLVLLYFSASWCPPCKAFTPKLSEFYKNHCVPNGIEIVYISSDSDVPSFNEYFGKMPWTSLPISGTVEIKQKLANALKIRGIPTLVVLDAETGFFVSDNARYDIMGADQDVVKCLELINSWMSIEAVPFEEAKFSADGMGGGIFKKIIVTLLTNPTYMIALFYIGKKLLKKLQDIGNQEDEL